MRNQDLDPRFLKDYTGAMNDIIQILIEWLQSAPALASEGYEKAVMARQWYAEAHLATELITLGVLLSLAVASIITSYIGCKRDSEFVCVVAGFTAVLFLLSALFTFTGGVCYWYPQTQAPDWYIIERLLP